LHSLVLLEQAVTANPTTVRIFRRAAITSLQKVLARNRPGVQPVRGPLLLITGGADILFTPAACQKVSARLCGSGARVQRSVYPGLGHYPLVYGSLREQIAWITRRISGEPAPSSCN
jgi:pimeloyl-ACP methyl ester carboxylesterase